MGFGKATSLYKTDIQINMPKGMKETQEGAFKTYNAFLSEKIDTVYIYTKVLKSVLDLFKTEEFIRLHIEDYTVYVTNGEIKFNTGKTEKNKGFFL